MYINTNPLSSTAQPAQENISYYQRLMRSYWDDMKNVDINQIKRRLQNIDNIATKRDPSTPESVNLLRTQFRLCSEETKRSKLGRVVENLVNDDTNITDYLGSQSIKMHELVRINEQILELIRGLQEGKEKLTKDNAELHLKVKGLEDSNETLTKDNAELQAKVKGLEEKVTKLEDGQNEFSALKSILIELLTVQKQNLNQAVRAIQDAEIDVDAILKAQQAGSSN